MSIHPAAIECLQELLGDAFTRLVPMYFGAKADAYAFCGSTDLDPSFALARGDELMLYWALTVSVDPETFPTTGAFAYAMPGEEGWTFATEEYATAATEGTYDVYEPEAVAALCSVRVAPAIEQVGDVPFDDPAYDAVEVAAVDPELVVDEAPVAVAPIQFHDALLYGDPGVEIVSKEIVHGFSPDGRRTDTWQNITLPIGQFLTGLAKHAVGPKDGASILQGSVINGLRTKKSMQAMHLIAIDVDNGTSVDVMLDRLKALGRLAVIYTTHSHMGTKTERQQDDFLKWAKKAGVEPTPTDASLACYLKEVRRVVPEIADTVRYVGMPHTDRGIMLVGEHAPMPKFRVVLPLAAPYVFAERGGSHMEAIRVWGEKILGLGELLSVAVDESCVDPSRLFYLPRHDEGRPFEIHIVAGSLIGIDEVPTAQKRRKILDPYSAAADDMGARPSNGMMTAQGLDLIRWSKEHGEGFELAAAFDMHAPERIRGRNGLKIAVECPFDGEHSNPGDIEDQGTFACNASESETQTGFAFKCMHAACADRKKLDMLGEAIRLGWLPEEVLTDPDYQSLTSEDALPALAADETEIDHEGSLKVLRDRIGTFTPNTSPSEIERALTVAVQADASALQMGDIIDRLMKLTKRKKVVIEADIKRIKAKIRSARTEEENLKALGITARPGTVPLLVDAMDEYQLLDRSKSILIDGNYRTPRVFSYNSQPYRCTIRPETQDLSLQAVNDRILTNELILHATYYEQRGENSARGILPPARMVQLIVEDTDFRLPTLEGFAKMPFLSKEGAIVQKPGYNVATGYMLTIKRDVDIPEVPEKPTLREAQVAHATLRETFSDFPFDDGEATDPDEPGQSSWAHFFAALMENFVRPAIPGPTPIFAITKPSPGTGGSLAVESLVQIATGAKPPILGQMAQDDDIRKMITSVFMRGSTVFVYDNIPDRAPVASTHWANLATASVWSDRQLGGNETIEAPNRILKIFVGNNTKYSHELARRCAPIRLDAKVSPLTRKGFKIPNFEAHIDANKGKLAACCLTIAKYWASRGMPQDADGPVLVSFEGWSRVMGGILKSIGVTGFLRNISLIQVAANDERLGWEQFVTEWYHRPDFGDPNPISNPEHDDQSLARSFYDGDSGSEIPGVYGKNGNQLASNLRRVLLTKVDNVFEVEAKAPATGTHQVRIRSMRAKGGGRGFYLERVIETTAK